MEEEEEEEEMVVEAAPDGEGEGEGGDSPLSRGGPPIRSSNRHQIGSDSRFNGGFPTRSNNHNLQQSRLQQLLLSDGRFNCGFPTRSNNHNVQDSCRQQLLRWSCRLLLIMTKVRNSILFIDSVFLRYPCVNRIGGN